MKSRYKYNQFSQVLKINIKMDGFPTSITLRKDIVSLWILMTEDVETDCIYLIQDFIYDIVLPIWTKSHGRGLSEFISKCMIRSVLSKQDFREYQKIQKKL